MLTTAEITEIQNSLPYDPPAECGALVIWRNERDLALNELQAQWREWLEREYASDIPSAAYNELYRRAWADGHSTGYSTVEDCYSEYAEFARVVVNALAPVTV